MYIYHVYIQFTIFLFSENTLEIAKINIKIDALNENDLSQFYCKNRKQIEEFEDKLEDKVHYEKFVSFLYYIRLL